MKRSALFGFIIALSVFAPGPAAVIAQESPFVPEELALRLANEVSGDRAFHYVRLLTPYHRIMGSPAFVEAANMLAGLAMRTGKCPGRPAEVRGRPELEPAFGRALARRARGDEAGRLRRRHGLAGRL